MNILGIIPSRYASTRFPGKPLIDIGGKSMIQRVYEQAKKAQSLTEVIVATDDERIYKEVRNFGGKAIMTAVYHKNGTERCAEVATGFNVKAIINIQGDEPFIHPEQIDLLAACFENERTEIATLIKDHPLNDELRNPSRIKVTVNKNMEALYFSRSVIPYPQNMEQKTANYYKHIGIYGYRQDILQELVQLPESMLEKKEALEQLRWLENGYKIKCAITQHESVSVDTPGDLQQILSRLEILNTKH